MALLSKDRNIKRSLKQTFIHLDWWLLGSAVLLSLAGLVTMHSLNDELSYFNRQLIWIPISLIVSIVCSLIDWRFLRRTNTVMTIYGATIAVLALLFVT